MSLIMVQEIVTIWGKRSRGGEAATKRNAVPEEFKLPSIPQIGYPQALIHDEISLSRGKPTHKLTVKELLPSESEISATFAYNRTCGGAPERTAFPRKVFTLPEGEWGQIRYNGRFGGSDGEWWYRKLVLNIGHFNRLTEDVFLTKPERIFSEMADLW